MVQTVDQENNPIAEADFESIDRLFNKDPQFLTEGDIDIIVEKLRANRHNWLKPVEKKARASGVKKKLSSDEVNSLLAELKL